MDTGAVDFSKAAESARGCKRNPGGGDGGKAMGPTGCVGEILEGERIGEVVVVPRGRRCFGGDTESSG